MPERFLESMNDSDDLMWTIESDPVLRSTITAVSLLDRAPEWDRFVRRMQRTLVAVPRLHQRVKVRPFRVARPDWEDVDLDLAYHVRRVSLPPPGTFQQVLDFARIEAGRGFDLERPLWEFTIVEGLEGGQAAIVQKVHHTVTDGIGGVRLLLELFDPEPEPKSADGITPVPAPRPGRSTWAAVRDHRGGRVRDIARVLPGLARQAVRSTATDPVGTARRTGRTIGSVGHLLTPVTEPMSPVLRGRGLDWQFDVFELPLDDLRSAAKRAGGKVNDVFLAALTQGLRDYHAAHGTAPHELYMTMPMNLREEGDPLGGNQFTPLRFKLPIDGPDGDERIRQMAAISHAEQTEPSVPLTPILAAVLDALPAPVVTPVFGGMLKNVDFVSTNVPGIPFRCWLAGAEVLRQWAFAPPSGAAINVALLTHAGIACVGIVADTVPVPDHEVLARCLADAFDAVVYPAGRRRRRAA